MFRSVGDGISDSSHHEALYAFRDLATRRYYEYIVR